MVVNAQLCVSWVTRRTYDTTCVERSCTWQAHTCPTRYLARNFWSLVLMMMNTRHHKGLSSLNSSKPSPLPPFATPITRPSSVLLIYSDYYDYIRHNDFCSVSLSCLLASRFLQRGRARAAGKRNGVLPRTPGT